MKNYIMFLFCLASFILMLSCSSSNNECIKKNNMPQVGCVTCTQVIKKLSPIEEQVIDEVNIVRTNPKFYIQFLEDRKKRFTGNILRVPGELPIITQEGESAVDEAINFLKSQKKLKPLQRANCLSLSAKDHAKDKGVSGQFGHEGSDGSTFMDRINRYVSGYIYGGENISYGSETPREIILDLIVDDGISSRGHRKNIFNANYKSIGVGITNHAKLRTICVMDFSSSRINN